MGHQQMTKAGWNRFVKAVDDLEDAAADGNTWGSETDATILANLAFAGQRRRLGQAAEAGKVWVATLDTGGISYSGREYVAVGTSKAEALAAIYKAWRKGRDKDARSPYGEEIKTPQQLVDTYAVRVVAVPVGQGVEGDW